MRIQILPLPSVVVGDDVEEPFVLIVDQYAPDDTWETATREVEWAAWKAFASDCGARAIHLTDETVEVMGTGTPNPPLPRRRADRCPSPTRTPRRTPSTTHGPRPSLWPATPQSTTGVPA